MSFVLAIRKRILWMRDILGRDYGLGALAAAV
jgi:hypothetical protein